MTVSSDMSGLLVGAGSIGRAHARVIASRYHSFIVVDPVADARRAVAELFSGDVDCFESLDEAMPKLTSVASKVTAIVANWGPDHAATFERLAEVGVTRFLVEKPMASSAASAHRMSTIARELGLRLIVGNTRRYNGMTNYIRALFQERGDEPDSFIVHGGALCTATNGMHWLDLACAVFRTLPDSVTADLQDGRINPRGPHLGYWGGTSTWRFSGGRRLTVTYSNGSSIGGQMSIYGRITRVDIDDLGQIWIGQRDPASVAADPRMTRYGPASQERQKITFRPSGNGTTIMLDLLESSEALVPDPSEHAAVVEAMLASLYSSEEGRRVSLPLDPKQSVFTYEWPAS